MPPILRKWSTDMTTKFLLAYEQYPCLWNPKHREYKHKTQRDRALQNIVSIMLDLVPDFDITYARAKIRSLRNAYILEHHKVVNSIKNNNGTGKIYKPTLSWFPLADRFLTNIVEPRIQKYILDVQKVEEYSEESRETEPGDVSHMCGIEENQLDYFSVESSSTPFTANMSPKSSYFDHSTSFNIHVPIVENSLEMKVSEASYVESKDNSCSQMFDTSVDPLETKQIDCAVDPLETDSCQTNPDEFDLFGKTVAANLRQMPLHVALESQCEILKFLVCRRLGRKNSL